MEKAPASGDVLPAEDVAIIRSHVHDWISSASRNEHGTLRSPTTDYFMALQSNCMPSEATGSAPDIKLVQLLWHRECGLLTGGDKALKRGRQTTSSSFKGSPGKPSFNASSEPERIPKQDTVGHAVAAMDRFQVVRGRIHDCLSGFAPRPVPANSDSKPMSKTTVGLVVNGTIVDGLVVGSPAFLCRKLRKGDEILQVDGKPATPESVAICLDPSRPPGCAVSLEYLSKVPEKRVRTITLCAITMQEAGERCNAIKLMEKLREQASKSNSPNLPALAEQISSFVVTSLANEARLQAHICSNFRRFFSRLKSDLDDIETCVAQLYEFAVTAIISDQELPRSTSSSTGKGNVEEMAGILVQLRSERDSMKTRLKDSEALVQHLQDDLRDVQQVIGPLNTSKHWLEKQVKLLEERLQASDRQSKEQSNDKELHLTQIIETFDQEKRNLQALLADSEKEIRDLKASMSKQKQELQDVLTQCGDLQEELNDANKHKEMLDSENQRLLSLETDKEKPIDGIEKLKQQNGQTILSSDYDDQNLWLDKAELSAKMSHLQHEIRENKKKFETRLQNSRQSIAVLMQENKELRHELDTARQIHKHDLERLSHSVPVNIAEMPSIQFSKRAQADNVDEEMDKERIPSIQFSRRPESGQAYTKGEKQFDVDDSSSDDYHHGESSELLDGSMSTQGTPRMESAEATYNAAVVEKDQAQALADKSHFESLLVENKMLLTQQKEELENLRGTAKENSALRVQLHDLIMSTGALEEKLAHLSANSDAETGTVAHAMQWDYEERIRKLYAELEDALCAADERSEQLAAKSIEMEILESQAIELRTDSHRAGNRESSESEAAETQVIEMIQMLEVSVEHMEADGAALCELVKEKHDIIQKIQTQLRETLGRESGRIDSNNLVATLRKRFELDAAREQKHLELVKLLQQEISEILVELLGAREDAARAMQIANCEWMTLESNLAHATQSLAAHSESESRVVQDLQDDIEHLHRQLEATSASESKAQQDLDECKVQCAKVKGELEQAQIAKTAIQQDLDQGKVQLAKVGGEPEKMQQDPDEHKMQLSKVEGELQQLRNLKKATESKLQQDLDDCKGQLAHVKEMFVQKVDAEIQLKQAFDECTTNLSHVQLELEQVQTDKTEMSRVIDSFRKEDVSSQNSAKIALAISQSKLDSTTAELRTCEQELITVNEDLTRAKQESAVFEEQLATAQESLQKRGKELVTVNTVLTRAKQESAVFEEQLAIAHESLQKRGEEFYALHGEATALKTQLGTLQEELARVKSDLQASQGESTVLKTQLNSTELEVAQERDQVKALKDKLKQQQEEWKQQQVLLSALQAQIFFANEDLKKPQGEFQKLEKEYHAMRDEIVVLKAELGNLQEELTATHGELGRVKPELQASRAEALELQAQLYTVKADFKKVDSARQEDLSAAELEVAKLRQKLEASQDETIGLTTQLKRAVDDLVKVRQEEKDLQKEMANISQQWKSLQNERVAREEQLETVLQERLAAQHEALKLQSQIENAQEFMKTAVQEIQERNDLQKIHVRTVEQLETLKKGHDTLKVLLNDAEERSQELEEEREMLMHDAENLVAHLAATLEDKMQMIQEAFANRLQKAKIETDALVAQAKAEAEAAAPLQVQSMEQQARSHGKQQKSEQLQQKVPGGTADEGAVEILASEENLVEMETLATLAGLHEKTRHAFEELIEARQALEDLRDNMRSRLIVFEKECERATADRLSLAKATRSMQEELMAQHDLRMEVQFLRSDNEKVHRRLAQLLDNLQPDNKSFSSLHEWIPGVDPRGRGNAPLPSGAKRVSDTNRTPVSLSSNHWIHGESSSYDFAASSERAEMGVGVVGQGKSMRTISPTALYTMPDEALTKPGPDGGAPIFDDQYFMELLEAANPQMKEDGIVTL